MNLHMLPPTPLLQLLLNALQYGQPPLSHLVAPATAPATATAVATVSTVTTTSTAKAAYRINTNVDTMRRQALEKQQPSHSKACSYRGLLPRRPCLHHIGRQSITRNISMP